MDIFEKLGNLPPTAKNAVIAIGNFDGVHRGHQALLQKAKDIAAAEEKPLGVLTFEPHPRALFQPDAPPYRITTPELKAWRLEEFGVDLLYALEFDWDFASQSAQDFIQKILIEGLGAAHIIVGKDFRFGQLRKGTPEDIEAAGLKATIIEKVADASDGELSSTHIRQLLSQGEMSAASKLLGWNWEMRGIVAKGDQRGRELGFPTANFDLGNVIHPAYGVYAARVQIEGEQEWRSAAINIGIRPMFEVHDARVESYILDFSGDIYGKNLRVQPIKRLRGEAKFNSLQELIEQMEKDCAAAREILKN